MALIGVAVTAFCAAPAAASAAERATVTQEVNLRAAPTTNSAALARLPAGASIDVVCWSTGEPTYGTDFYGSLWLLTGSGGWIHSNLASPVNVGPCAGATTAVPVQPNGQTAVPVQPNGQTAVPVQPNGRAVVPLLPNGQYENCDAARAAGPTPLTPLSPGYGPHLDRDKDGLACEAGD
jgi:hypothetical protein